MSGFVKCICTNCGGHLKIASEKDTWKCEYCGSLFLVKDAINLYQTTINLTINAEQPEPVLPNDDFEIVAGSLLRYKGKNSVIRIPDEVIAINDGVFEAQKGITKVIIPPRVKHIGKRAFKNCINLLEVDCYAPAIHEISDEAFMGCHSLIEFTLPEFCSEIGVNAFSDCSSLKAIRLHHDSSCLEDLKLIKNSAFSNCVSLELVDSFTVVKNQGLQYYTSPIIEDRAFYNCKSLRIDFDWFKLQSFRKIGKYSFFGCWSLQNICIPAHCIIDDYAFSECNGLLSITVEGDSEIHTGAFANCSHLKKIYYNESLSMSQIKSFPGSFDNTPLLKKHKNRLENNKCLYCGGKTKLGINGGTSFFPRICEDCGEEQDYGGDSVLSSDFEYIQPYRKKKNLCRFCGERYLLGSNVCAKCGRKKDY